MSEQKKAEFLAKVRAYFNGRMSEEMSLEKLAGIWKLIESECE